MSQLHKAYVGLPSPPRIKIMRARYPLRLALLSDSSAPLCVAPLTSLLKAVKASSFRKHVHRQGVGLLRAG